MVKRYFVALLLMVACLAVAAQDWTSPETESFLRTYIKNVFNVSGKVYGVDEYDPKPYPLQGANITVTCIGDTTQTTGMAAGDDGSFWSYLSCRERLRDTRVRIVVSYLGMETFDSIFSPPMQKSQGIDTYIIQLDSLVLRSNPLTTQEVEIVAELQRMYQRGDTVIFNVGAYEMPTGSVLLNLVRRLPGLKYENGRMTYLGQDINEIRLNGNSFFQRDMSIALNNMPTDKIKSLKVYEVPEDTLDVTSKNHLIMDMETHEPVERTLFANVGVGSTIEFDNYSANADVSVWTENNYEMSGSVGRSTIPNSYSPTLESTSTQGNLYLSKRLDKLSVNASASYYDDYDKNRSESYNKMFMPEYTQNSYSNNTNSNGSSSLNGSTGVSGSVTDKIWLSMNMNIHRSRNSSSMEQSDSIVNEGEGLVSSTEQTSESLGESDSYSMNGNMRWDLGEGNRYRMDFGFNAGRNEGSSTSINRSESHFVQLGDSVRKVDHRIYTPNSSNNWSLSSSFSTSLGKEQKGGYLSFGYNFTYNDGKSIQSYDDMGADGTLNQVDSLYYDKRNSRVGNRMNLFYYYSDSLYQVNLNGDVAPEVQTIDNYNKVEGKSDEHIRYVGTHYNVSANFRVKVRKKSQIGIGYSGSNGLPGAEQLSMVTDYSNPMYIREGNSSLKNSFTHNVNMEFQFRSWMRTRVSYGATKNQITTLTRLNKQTGARITSPANIDGNWNVSEYLFASLPLRDVSLDFTANHTLSHNVAYVQSFTDDAAQKSATDYNQLSLSLSAAYSDKYWMLMGGVSYGMDKSQSDYLSSASGGKRVNAYANVEFTAPFGLGVGSDFDFTRPFGYAMESANRPECMWNMNIQYGFLKDRQAVVNIEWRDILQSYSGFNANVNGTSWSESRSYGDSSMFVVTLSYRFGGFR